MGNVMPINGAAAGAIGSPYVAKVSSLNVASGNYSITEANFPGIGQYIPGWALVVGTANLTIHVSSDNTAYQFLSGTGGGWIYMDSGNTVQLSTTGGGITIFPMAR